MNSRIVDKLLALYNETLNYEQQHDLIKYIKIRLDDTLNQYESQLSKDVDYLSIKTDLQLIKKLNKK